VEDRAATAWHDIGLVLKKNDADEVGFQVRVGGGMGRTPIVGTVLREFLPWKEILVYIEAIVRVYNRYGRRDKQLQGADQDPGQGRGREVRRRGQRRVRRDPAP
jgi:sulfite reductase (NADPH) hemoprotein beta-component